MTLGVSRRSYFVGTLTLMLGLAVAYGAVLTVLWWLEGLTGGWWMRLHFFRVPWILDGPWSQVLLTNVALLAMSLLFGLWCGLVYRRFGSVGIVAFLAALTLTAVIAAVLVTWGQAWSQVGRFLAELDIVAGSLLVAVVAAVAGLGGFLTIRRITV